MELITTSQCIKKKNYHTDNGSPFAECPLSLAEHRLGHLVREHCVKKRLRVKPKISLYCTILKLFRSDNPMTN